MMEQISGLCPKCGKELQLPEELAEFSCLYCGARLRREELRRPAQALAQDADASARCYAAYCADVLRTVRDYPNVMRRMTKSQFFDFSDEYLQACRGPFDQLEQAVLQQNEQRDALVSQAVDELMRQLNEWLDGIWAVSRKNKYRITVDEAKFTIALMLVPMLRRSGLSIAEDYCTRLHKAWVAQYPFSPFQLASYDELAAGFQRKKWCFITTAVCRDAGKPDDCPELTAFRAFRDGYLAACPDGPALIAEYYDCAPGIVSRIEFCEDSRAVYAVLRREYLQPCYQALQRGDNAACRARYVEMVRSLQRGMWS